MNPTFVDKAQPVALDSAVQQITQWGEGRAGVALLLENATAVNAVKQKKFQFAAHARKPPGAMSPDGARSFAEFFHGADRDIQHARSRRNRLNAAGVQKSIDQMYRVALLASALDIGGAE